MYSSFPPCGDATIFPITKDQNHLQNKQSIPVVNNTNGTENNEPPLKKFKQSNDNVEDTPNKIDKTVKKGYDIDKAVSHIQSNALSKSNNECAKYVRLAIEAGGLKSNTQPRNALNYFGILKELGFTELKTTTYIKGDIVVFDGLSGHIYGHIAMWTGTEWISDFKQNSIIVNNAYKDGKSSIFRWQ